MPNVFHCARCTTPKATSISHSAMFTVRVSPPERPLRVWNSVRPFPTHYRRFASSPNRETCLSAPLDARTEYGQFPSLRGKLSTPRQDSLKLPRESMWISHETRSLAAGASWPNRKEQVQKALSRAFLENQNSRRSPPGPPGAAQSPCEGNSNGAEAPHRPRGARVPIYVFKTLV